MNIPADETARPLSFGQRLVGMFTSPGKVFESLRPNPIFLDMLLFFTLVGAVSYLPKHPIIQREAVRLHVVEEHILSPAAFGEDDYCGGHTRVRPKYTRGQRDYCL